MVGGGGLRKKLSVNGGRSITFFFLDIEEQKLKFLKF